MASIPLSLLNDLQRVPYDRPVALLMRHSARHPIVDPTQPYIALLTAEGVKLAEELGAVLGKSCSPGRLMAAPVERCQDTAAAIARGAGWTAYVRAEEYTNQMISALREKKTEEFRNKYRSVEMLLVDDVQFFGGKTQTAENFFHTFDELHNANRQIALTSDRPPKSIPALQERLSSRFEGGLVTDIEAPEFETRLAILKDKARQKEVDVSTDVLELIALQIQQSIRALEGSLNRVIAYAKLVRSMLTPELAARALKDISGDELKAAPATPRLIMEAVVNSFQLTPSDLMSRKRDEATALARQVAMYLMRQETDCSLAEIGRELGGRTPATVSYSYQKIAGDINNSPSLRRKVFQIQQELSAGANHKSF